jgi:hypothetical protein
MKPVFLGLFIIAAIPAAQQGTRQFTGTITDSMCPAADHSGLRMGPTNAECTIACVEAHGALYVLYDGKNAYTLSDQKTPEKFAGQKVNVTGTLEAKTMTIRVDAISASK